MKLFLFQLLFIPTLFLFFIWFLFFTQIGNKILFPTIEKSFSMYANRTLKVKIFNSLYGDLYFNLSPNLPPMRLIEIRIEYSFKCLNFQYQEVGNTINMEQYMQVVLPEYSNVLKLETDMNFSEPIYFQKQFCLNN